MLPVSVRGAWDKLLDSRVSVKCYQHFCQKLGAEGEGTLLLPYQTYPAFPIIPGVPVEGCWVPAAQSF